jgi:type IV pilus assembly protein PilO
MDIDVKDPKFLRWAAAIVLVAVALPLYFTSTMYPFTYASGKAEVAKLDAKHQALSRDLEKARLLVRNLERVEKEYAILHQQWEVAQALLPEKNEMPNLLRKVTAAGQQSGIEFTMFRPQNPLARGFYSDNPVEVRIEGGYHQTGVFLSRLANLNRIVNVSDLKISGMGDKNETPFTLKADFILTAYTLDSAGVAGATDVGSAPGEIEAKAKANAKVAKAGAGH